MNNKKTAMTQTPAEHFGWKDHPFLDTCREHFLTRAENRYLDLAFGLLKQGKSCTLTGPAGTGKTTFVTLLLQKLDTHSFLPLHLHYGGLVRNGLLRTLAEVFRLDSGKRTIPTLTRIHQHLLALAETKPVLFPVLVVDDAQHLEIPSLLDLCSLLHQNQKPTAALILVGDESLLKKISLHTLDPVSSRMACNIKLSPLSAQESVEFLTARLSQSKAPRDLFQNEALHLLSVSCRGSRRRLLNTAATLCLEAMANQERTITADLVSNSTLCEVPG